MAKDVIKWEILEDGTLSIETDGISGVNHYSADEFIADVSESLGGKVTVEKKKDAKAHVHHGTKAHVH
jgi:hypothetical protein